MPYIRTPMGITPPAPGLDHEEPEFVAVEEDIPGSDTGARAERNADERPLHAPERE